MHMCNKERLVAYLYDDLNAIERTDFEAHLAACASCRDELGGLRQTRQHLAAWAPPEPEINFQIVRSTAAPPARRVAAGVPRWAIAAAAALVLLAGAAAIANVEVRYEQDGSLIVRTGWAGAPSGPDASSPVVPGAAQAAGAAGASEETARLQAAVAALTARVQQLEAQPSAVVAAGTRPGISPADLRKILAESEARQRTETAVQIAQVWQDFSVARANDVARLQDVIGRAQGLTNYQLRQHRDSIESLYRVSASQQK